MVPQMMPKVPKTRRETARTISLIGGRLLTVYDVSIIMSSSDIEKAWSTYAIVRFVNSNFGFFRIVGGFESCLGFGCLRALRWSFLVLKARDFSIQKESSNQSVKIEEKVRDLRSIFAEYAT